MKKAITAVSILLVSAIALIFAAPKLTEYVYTLLYPRDYSETVQAKAAQFGLEEELVYAVIRTESGFNARAESRAGACGLMQLTPQTFEWMLSKHPLEAPDIFDPEDNIHCGCACLRLLINQFGSVDVALAAYNAGMGNVSSWLKDPRYSVDGLTLSDIPYPETEQYVLKVKEAMSVYERLYG